MEMSRDAGSNPAASTNAECKTRLDGIQARQPPAVGLFFCATYRELFAIAIFANRKSRDASQAELAPKSALFV